MKKLFLASAFILAACLLAPEAKADWYPGFQWPGPNNLPGCVCPALYFVDCQCYFAKI